MSPILGIFASQGRVAANSFESIATVTVGAGGQSSISFSSIPSTYKHLQIRGIVNIGADINIRFNGDTTSNYAFHFMYGAGSTPVSSGSTTQNYGYLGYGNFGGSTAFTCVVADILDSSNTNKNKTVRSLTGVDGNTTGGGVMLASSLWQSSSAVSSITLYSKDSVNFGQYSQFALYGIK